jgi:hypothetical protein
MPADGTDGVSPAGHRGSRSFRGGWLALRNQDTGVSGLEIKRTVPSGNAILDVVVFLSANANRGTIVNCRVDGRRAAFSTKFTGKDGIQTVQGAGATPALANRVKMTEVTGAQDKGIKAVSGYLIVEDSWIHHNLDGGVQATLGGNVEVYRSLVERSGYNTAGALTSVLANGISIQAGTSTSDTPVLLTSNGNIIRDNASRGISVRFRSTATITNDYVCGTIQPGTSAQNGIALLNEKVCSINRETCVNGACPTSAAAPAAGSVAASAPPAASRQVVVVASGGGHAGVLFPRSSIMVK